MLTKIIALAEMAMLICMRYEDDVIGAVIFLWRRQTSLVGNEDRASGITPLKPERTIALGTLVNTTAR